MKIGLPAGPRIDDAARPNAKLCDQGNRKSWKPRMPRSESDASPNRSAISSPCPARSRSTISKPPGTPTVKTLLVNLTPFVQLPGGALSTGNVWLLADPSMGISRSRSTCRRQRTLTVGARYADDGSRCLLVAEKPANILSARGS